MVPHVHGELSTFLTHPKYGRYRQATVPRSWFKTWVGTIGGAIWLTLPDEAGTYREAYPYKGPDVRILIASNISDNAMKMVDKIRHEWMKNDRLKAAFPEIVPEYNKVRWSNSCAEVNRDIVATEGTYTSVGAGGGVISQHFDHIIEDDLVYAKKDDFSGQELMPNQEDIDKAVGWHKLAMSLFVNPNESGMWNIGTRWAPHDLVDFIRTNEQRKYYFFEIAVTDVDKNGRAIWPIKDDKLCIWPERYGRRALEEIRDAQGPKIFQTQYLNYPIAGEDVTFDCTYLRKHDSIDEFPKHLEYRTVVDLASWGDKKRLARNVVLTGAKDHKNNLWVARVDAGRYTPTQVINTFKAHQLQFNSKVLVEEIQYQRSIRHFARELMSKDGHWYHIDQLPVDNRKDAKILRINGLEPLVKNGALHVLKGMRELIQEMEDFPYGTTVDILDALGWLFKMAMPTHTKDTFHDEGLYHITREKLEKECKEAKSQTAGGTQYPFGTQLEDILQEVTSGY